MKKLLSILGGIGVAATASAGVVACGTSNTSKTTISSMTLSDYANSAGKDGKLIEHKIWLTSDEAKAGEITDPDVLFEIWGNLFDSTVENYYGNPTSASNEAAKENFNSQKGTEKFHVIIGKISNGMTTIKVKIDGTLEGKLNLSTPNEKVKLSGSADINVTIKIVMRANTLTKATFDGADRVIVEGNDLSINKVQVANIELADSTGKKVVSSDNKSPFAEIDAIDGQDNAFSARIRETIGLNGEYSLTIDGYKGSIKLTINHAEIPQD